MSQQPFAVEAGFEIVSDFGDTQYLRGTVDPTDASGIPASVSSLYNRDVGGAGTSAELWQKFGAGDTQWQQMASGTTSGVIGPAEDSDYTDGLFTDFTDTTPTGTAIDRFNEVLAALAPPPAPLLDDIDGDTNGVTAKLSFGPSGALAGYTDVDGAGASGAVDINGTFSSSGDVKGVIDATTNVTGTLNEDVPADGDGSYPMNAFGDGDLGTLELIVNGAVIHSVDLTSVGAGSDNNVNGSGFTLIAATAVQFAGGGTLDQFKYRTGSWTVNQADLQNGYNYIRVNHNFGSVDHFTNYIDYVVDDNLVALSATGGGLAAPSMTGSKYLSGVQYHTGGTSTYTTTISNVHRNCYSNSGSAISFSVSNCSVSSRALGNIADEGDTEPCSEGVTVTASSRLLDAQLSVSVNAVHPLKSNLSNADAQTADGVLLDNVAASSGDTGENFDDEDYRLLNTGAAVNNYAAQADVGSGTWASSSELDSGVGYNNELLIYNGRLYYPTGGLDAGDFRNVSDGNANGPEAGYAGNPNYSALAGDRTYYREFVNNSGSTKANFRINVAGSSTTFTDVGSGVSGNNLNVEMKFPDGSISVGTGWMDCYADFATANWADGDGCRNAGTGAGRALSTNWGLTVGTKSIAAGESVVLRITAAAAWSGYLTDLDLTWL